MNKEKLFSSKSDEWETPRDIFNLLRQEFAFERDVASTGDNHLCERYWTKEDDALKIDWSASEKVFWCNPPYGHLIGKFVKKCYEESLKGCLVVCLIPSRTDTKWWHAYCSKGQVRFIKGRLKFVNRTFPSWRADGNFKVSSAPFPTAIVIFGNGKPSTTYVEF